MDDKLKRPVVKLAPTIYESVFRAKNRDGNVVASHQKAEKVDSEHAGSETKPNVLENDIKNCRKTSRCKWGSPSNGFSENCYS